MTECNQERIIYEKSYFIDNSFRILSEEYSGTSPDEVYIKDAKTDIIAKIYYFDPSAYDSGSHNVTLVWNNDFQSLSNLSYMFKDCNNIVEIKFYGFVLANVTTMESMFLNCLNLTSIDFSNFDTTLVTNMAYMFSRCRKLASLNLSNFNTDIVTNMDNMFSECQILPFLNLSNFNTSKVTNMSYMFNHCNSLKTLD